jgi:iron complex transport system ATP-binding protein
MTLAAHNLTLRLGTKDVVQEASVSFTPGKVAAILGPNGAGKTSLIRALVGLIAPISGLVTLNDRPLPPAAERARRIGYLPQNGVPAWNVTVRELVGLGRLPQRARFTGPNDADEAAIEAAMTATDTTQLADRSVDTLSGGELARVKMARVFAGEPEWIVADEPLANLDPPHQRDMLALLRRAADSGTGVIAVLHQLNAATRVADHVLLLSKGIVIANGDTRDILTPSHLKQAFDADFDVVDHDAGRHIFLRA